MPEIRNGTGPRNIDTIAAIHVKHEERIRLPRDPARGRKRPWLSNAKLIVTAETAHGYFVPIREIRGLDHAPKATKLRVARTVFSELIGETVVIELGFANTPDGPYQHFIGRISNDHPLAEMTWLAIRERERQLTKVGGTD